jgi:hypothetical protein
VLTVSHSNVHGVIGRCNIGYRVTYQDQLIHMPAHAASRPPRHQIKKPGNPRGSTAVLFPNSHSNTTLPTTHYRTPTARTHTWLSFQPPNILRSPFMGSASPSTTAFFLSAAQLTLVGSAFPYSPSTAGLNKTDASFASLVRQVGDGGPP